MYDHFTGRRRLLCDLDKYINRYERYLEAYAVEMFQTFNITLGGISGLASIQRDR